MSKHCFGLFAARIIVSVSCLGNKGTLRDTRFLERRKYIELPFLPDEIHPAEWLFRKLDRLFRQREYFAADPPRGIP